MAMTYDLKVPQQDTMKPLATAIVIKLNAQGVLFITFITSFELRSYLDYQSAVERHALILRQLPTGRMGRSAYNSSFGLFVATRAC
jgi:hypothetical protein